MDMASIGLAMPQLQETMDRQGFFAIPQQRPIPPDTADHGILDPLKNEYKHPYPLAGLLRNPS